MVETSRGLVLRVRPLTETSLIVHWLTPELGRLATVAKGALRPKSPFRGKLDLFYEAAFSFVRSRRSDLHTLREVVLANTHTALRRDLGLLQQASYAAVMIEQSTETESPLPEVFDLITGFLDALPPGGGDPKMVLGFELKLLTILGLGPDADKTHLGPPGRILLHQLVVRDWSALSELAPAPAELRQLEQFLHGYIIYHLGRLSPGRAAALDSPSR